MDTSNKQIFVFKEERSGSRWAVLALASLLNRVPKDLPVQKNLASKEDYLSVFQTGQHNFTNVNDIYHTHNFFLLPYLKNENTYLIRTTRRNRIEQVLSMIYINYYPKTIKHFSVNDIQNARAMTYFNNTLANPVLVKKQDVINSLKKLKEQDQIWQEHTQNADKTIIVYEDCESGAILSDLEVTLKWSEHTDVVKKAPPYKDKVFSNYNQVVDWVDNWLANNSLTQY